MHKILRVTSGGITSIEDEGIPVSGGPFTVLDFIGAGVTVTGVGGQATITIPGAGGGGGDSYKTITADIGSVTAVAAEETLSLAGINGISTTGTDGSPDAITINGVLLLPRDGSRAMTGNLDMGAFAITNVGNVDGRDVSADGSTLDTHVADSSIHFTEASIDHTAIQNIGTNSHAAIDSHIADSSIHFTEASIDHANILNIGTNSHAAIDTHIADGSIHFTVASIDHGLIAGLGDDDHTQYLLLAGRSGGQTANGGTASGEDLTLVSTAHATKGSVFFGATQTSAYDEVNDRLGIGIAAPGRVLDVQGTVALMARVLSSDTGSTQFAINNTDSVKEFSLMTSGSASSLGGGHFTIYDGTAHRFVIRDSSGNIGIGSNVLATNTLDIEGNSAIGSSYAGTETAPTDGLLVEGLVGIGLTTLTNKLSVAVEDTPDAFLMTSASNTVGARPVMSVLRSRGTLASRLAVTDGDPIGGIIFSGFINATDAPPSASIEAQVDGTPGTTAPGELQFHTAGTSGARIQRAVIDSSGFVGINETDPDAHLHVVPGAVGTTAIGGQSYRLGVYVETTSSRSGFVASVANNFLDSADVNGHYLSLFPFDDSTTSDDRSWKAFKLMTGATLADAFWVNKYGEGYFDSLTLSTDPGANAPVTKLDIVENNLLDAIKVFGASTTASTRPVIKSVRGRGTVTSPTTVSDNDQLGSWICSGYNTSNVERGAASIEMVTDGTPGTEVPAEMRFLTATSSSGRTERMIIRSDGDIGISTVDPVARLEVEDGGTGNSMVVKVTSDNADLYSMILGNDTFSATDTDGLAMHVTNAGLSRVEARGSGAELQFGVNSSWIAKVTTSGLEPVSTDTFDLGSPSDRWRELYLTGSSIHLGSRTLSTSANGWDLDDDTTVNGDMDVTGTATLEVVNTNQLQVSGVDFKETPWETSGIDITYEQGRVGIGTPTTVSGVALEVNEQHGGLLLPRMTEAERDLLPNIEGMMIYNTSSGIFQGYSASGWKNLHTV